MSTEIHHKACTWLRGFSSASCLNVLPSICNSKCRFSSLHLTRPWRRRLTAGRGTTSTSTASPGSCSRPRGPTRGSGRSWPRPKRPFQKPGIWQPFYSISHIVNPDFVSYTSNKSSTEMMMPHLPQSPSSPKTKRSKPPRTSRSTHQVRLSSAGYIDLQFNFTPSVKQMFGIF